MIHPESEIRNVRGIKDEEIRLIKAYLQGAVYAWVRDRPGAVFAARDLVGGANFEWAGTPLYVLYKKYENTRSNEQAIEAAAKDLGWLLKSVLAEDKRNFNVTRSGLTAAYSWVGDEA